MLLASQRSYAPSSSMAVAEVFCFVVLLALCLLASMALMLGYYGSVELVAGPGCSRLVQGEPPLRAGHHGEDGGRRRVGREWGRALWAGRGSAPRRAGRVVVPAKTHREWVYFLNRGSQIEVDYSVKPETELIYPLCIIIAQGKESFRQWIEKPSVHNTTLSWRLVHGNGTIKQTIDSSYEYYIVVGNLNDHDTTVLLDFRIRAVFYNTTGADYASSPGKSLCTYRLPILGQNVAVLSSGFEERLNPDDDEQYVKAKLSYGPRWIVHVLGSAILAVSLLLLYEILNALFGFCAGGNRPGTADQRASLLANKEEEDASLGSSYDFTSHDDDGDEGDNDDDAEGRGEGRRHRHLCVVCCDAPKDCFFLPCGHSATCHACGTRVLEGDGSCPFCRRKLKKVRRIFAVLSVWSDGRLLFCDYLCGVQ